MVEQATFFMIKLEFENMVMSMLIINRVFIRHLTDLISPVFVH